MAWPMSDSAGADQAGYPAACGRWGGYRDRDRPVMTPWLVHELRGRELEVVCLDARHARAALKMQLNKTDQNDAEGLAQIMRTGWYRSVHVKSFEAHRVRALLGARAQLVGMTTALDPYPRRAQDLRIAARRHARAAVRPTGRNLAR